LWERLHPLLSDLNLHFFIHLVNKAPVKSPRDIYIRGHPLEPGS
jgi:hypothetical protein